LKTEFFLRIQSSIKINIRYVKPSIYKHNHKDYNQLQNLVIFSYMFITRFWNWVLPWNN